MRLYRLYDQASESWMRLVPAPTDAAVMRSLEKTVNDPNGGDVASHPEHFSLFCVGSYSEDSPLPEIFPSPLNVCVLTQLKKALPGPVADLAAPENLEALEELRTEMVANGEIPNG